MKPLGLNIVAILANSEDKDKVIMGKWTEIEDKLKSTNDDIVTRTLEHLVLDDTKLDDEGTKVVVKGAIEKLAHHDIKVRSNAVAVVAKQMREQNTAMVYMVDDLGKALANPTLLDLKDSAGKGEVYTLLHKDLCYVIEELQKRFPGKLMPSFKPVAQYIVQAVGSPNIEVCIAASSYWCSLKQPTPVPPKYMAVWMKTVTPKLQKLVSYLMKALEYHKEYVDYLHTKTRAQAKAVRPETTSQEMESYIAKRGNAATALESVFQIFGPEATNVFKLNLIAKIKSSEWMEVEAATLALGLFTQVMGTPPEMQSCYGEVVNKILDNFKSPNSLLRAISCFAMQNFVNAKLKGVKNPFSKTVKGALHAILDESMTVQTSGMQCLSTILTYSEQDLQPHANKITESLVKAESAVFGDTLNAYYQCLGSFIVNMGSALDKGSIEALTGPLVQAWRNIDWETQKSSDPNNVMLVCQSLCMVALASKETFSANNDVIFEKAVSFLSSIANSANGHSLKDTTTTGLMVACLDVIGCIFQSQPSAIPSLSDKYDLTSCITKILTNKNFDAPVHQSAMAIFGHLCQHHYPGIQRSVADILKQMEQMLKSPTSDLARNAVWALSQLTAKTEEKSDALFLLSNQLAEMFQDTQGEETTVVSAALALTNIGVKWGDNMLALFTKENIFVHLCAILQVGMELDQEKIRLFQNVNSIYSSCIGKVNPQLWVHYCAAAAMFEINDPQVEDSIKNMLKEVRGAVGNTIWNQINKQLGKQASINLRKKYKLY